MARRTCPACSRRYAQLVAPDCPVCEGVGVLGLHPVALAPVGLKPTDPAVVSRAVEFYLEGAAREAAGQLPLGDPLTQALTEAVERLQAARVIDAPIGVPDVEGHWVPNQTESRATDSEAARASFLLGQHHQPSDRANLDAPQVVYGPDDRPRAYGMLPTVSANGYPSALAKAADPTDALGPDTRAMVYERQARDHGAQVLANAVDGIVAIRDRKSL